MFYMPIIEHDAWVIPFALWIYEHGVWVWKMHCIVYSQFLPFFQFGGSVCLFPTFYINQLIFRAGYIRNFKIRIFYYVIKHAAIATVRKFPIPVKNKIVKFPIGYDITWKVTSVTICLNTSIYYMPRLCEWISIIVTPAIECVSIK